MQKLILIATIMLLLGAFSAAADSLEIDKVEIDIDGRRVLSTSSSSSSLDVEPRDQLRIEVRLENTFDEDTDNDIEDVKVYAFIDNIDDGDDIDDDSDRITVRADNERTVKLRLTIPKDAESSRDYDLVIVAKGYDQNGIEHSDEVSIDVEVEREENELIFESLRVSDAECDRDAVIRIEIQNIGEEEEQDVELRVTHPVLGTLFMDRFDLQSILDKDSTYVKTKRLDLDDVPYGRHSLGVELEYNNGRETLQETVGFRKIGCGTVTESGMEKTVDMSVEPYTNPNRDTTLLFRESGPEVVVQLPPPGVKAPSLPAADAPEQSGFSTLVLFLADIAILIFIILLVMSLYEHLNK